MFLLNAGDIFLCSCRFVASSGYTVPTKLESKFLFNLSAIFKKETARLKETHWPPGEGYSSDKVGVCTACQLE